MNDANTVKSWVEAATAAIGALKSIIQSLPSGKNREDAERLMAEVEREQKKAEASLAQRLGFELCERCWPPEIILVSSDGTFRCRRCGQPPRQKVTRTRASFS